MDAFGVVSRVLITLLFVLLSNQMPLDPDSNGTTCPLVDNPTTVNGTVVHNITQAIKCENGRKMAGCCITRLYCNYSTSSIDLTVYGPPGFRMSCSDVCCPHQYILPLPNLLNTTDTSEDDDDDDDSVENDEDY